MSLLTALKVIPWGEVITAAPGLVKGARKIFARAQDTAAPVDAPGDVPGSDPLRQALQRVDQLEAGMAGLREQQQAAAALLESLAEQNAQVVQAIEILRLRTRVLSWAAGLLCVGLVGAVVVSCGGFGIR
jgi:hypothetical protein